MMKNITLDIVNGLKVVSSDTAKTALLGSLAPTSLPGHPTRLAFINAHAVNLCYRNPEFFKNIMECDIILRDGSGMKLLYKLLGRDPGLNMNGTDFIPELIAQYRDTPIALLGTTAPYLEKAESLIAAEGGRVVAMMDGFQDEEAYLSLVKQTRPTLIILAMGMPKQERVAAYLSQNVDFPCLIVCGGAILDFMGGKVKRAPLLFRAIGMEWVFRLISEPKRLFGRYVIGNGIFLGRSLWIKLTLK